MAFNIVLVNPEIPQNTGNIARSCAATGAVLHLIEPLGFSLADKYLKRAGLDYWHLMEYHVYSGMEEFLKTHPGAGMYFATTKARKGYHEVRYQDGDFLVFGWIPMRSEARSLNLANSVAVVLFEALRQNGFPGMQSGGQLTGREEEQPAWLDYV